MRAFSTIKNWLVLLSCAAISLSSSSAFAEESNLEEEIVDQSCTVQAMPAGVECVMADGDALWDSEHGSLWEWRQSDDPAPVYIVEVDGRTYYSVYQDLLEIDVTEGMIIDRVQFPGLIVGLEAGDGEMQVSLNIETSDAFEDSEILMVRYGLDGPRPSQSIWNTLDARPMSTIRDSRHFWDTVDYDDDNDDKWIAHLKEGQKRDLTNPFFAFDLGLNYLNFESQDAAEYEKARAHFRDAVETPGAHWHDLIFIVEQLESFGTSEFSYSDLADRAFERALQQMDDLGIARERLFDIFVYIVPRESGLNTTAPSVLAIRDGDSEKLDGYFERLYQLMPNCRGCSLIFDTLAQTMIDHDEPELAQKWQNRAQASHDLTAGLIDTPKKKIDVLRHIIRTILIVLIPLFLFIGLRGGLRRRKEGTGNPWLPSIALKDLVIPLLLVGLLIPLSMSLNVQEDKISTLSFDETLPLADNLAWPAVADSLEGLHESPAQQELLAISAAERQALVDGVESPPKEPVFSLLEQAIQTDARHQQVELLMSAQVPNPRSAADYKNPTTSMSILSALLALSGLGLLIFVGGVIGYRLPRATRWGLRIIPGGPKTLAPVGAVLLTLFVACQTFLVVADRNFYFEFVNFYLSTVSVHGLFEHQVYETLLVVYPAELYPHYSVLAFIVIPFLLVCHGIIVWMDIKSDDSQS